jgi:hypothetical protein
MITYEDCLSLADLTPEAVDRVAAREGLTAIAAVGLASRLAVTAEDRWNGCRTTAATSSEAPARPAMIPAWMAPAQLRTDRLAA